MSIQGVFEMSLNERLGWSRFLLFSAKYHLLRLFSQIKINKIIFHFPLRKVAALDWMLLTTEKRDVLSAKRLQFEDTPFDKSLT